VPVKSSRFSRLAYSRRAALLADDLLDWSRIYDQQINQWEGGGHASSDFSVLTERVEQLAQMGMQLQRISIALVALR
jgi:hypothetical protein